MRAIITVGILLLTGLSFPLMAGNDFCGLHNTAFQAGEQLTYKVYYSVLGGYFAAGEANFTTTLEKLNKKDVYHVVSLQYREGIKTYLDVIISQSDLRTAELNYYNALFQLLSSKIDLQKALGTLSAQSN